MILSFISGDGLKHVSIPKQKEPVMLDGLVWGLRRGWRKSHFPRDAVLTAPLTMGVRVSAPSVVLHSWLEPDSVRVCCHCQLMSRYGVWELCPSFQYLENPGLILSGGTCHLSLLFKGEEETSRHFKLVIPLINIGICMLSLHFERIGRQRQQIGVNCLATGRKLAEEDKKQITLGNILDVPGHLSGEIYRKYSNIDHCMMLSFISLSLFLHIEECRIYTSFWSSFGLQF